MGRSNLWVQPPKLGGHPGELVPHLGQETPGDRVQLQVACLRPSTWAAWRRSSLGVASKADFALQGSYTQKEVETSSRIASWSSISPGSQRMWDTLLSLCVILKFTHICRIVSLRPWSCHRIYLFSLFAFVGTGRGLMSKTSLQVRISLSPWNPKWVFLLGFGVQVKWIKNILDILFFFFFNLMDGFEYSSVS